MNKTIQRLVLVSLVFVFAMAGSATALANYDYYNYYSQPTHNSSTITKYATVGRYFEFDVYASDDDYGSSYYPSSLKYWATYLPIGARFDESTRIFSWTPQRTGKFSAKFRVSDGFDYADLEVIINVENTSPVVGVRNDVDPEPAKIIIINTQPEEPKTIYVPVDPAEEVVEDECEGEEEDVCDKEEVEGEEGDLTLADTILGIIDNIIFNSLLLLVLIVVLLVLLYFYRKRNKELEQELDMK